MERSQRCYLPPYTYFQNYTWFTQKNKETKKTPVYLYPCRSIVKWGEERSDPSDTTADWEGGSSDK